MEANQQGKKRKRAEKKRKAWPGYLEWPFPAPKKTQKPERD